MPADPADFVALAARDRARARRVGLILLALAAPLLGLGGLSAVEGWRTLDWPRVPAEILSSGLLPAPGVVPAGRDGAAGPVLYRYRLSGVERMGDGIEPGAFAVESAAGPRHRRRYPSGAWALAAVDPADPSVAYLEPGPSTAALLALGIGLIAGLSGGAVLSLSRNPSPVRRNA